MAYDIHDRILGSLVTSGMGDALGVPSEAFSRTEIIETLGGEINCFLPPGENVYGAGNLVGEVTDDTSQMFEMAKAIIKTRGKLTVDAAAEALLNWTKTYPKYYPRNAGPTMSHWTAEYKAGADPLVLAKIGKTYGRGISNGCAMRVAPAGLVNPGDWDGAVKTAITMTFITLCLSQIVHAMNQHSNTMSFFSKNQPKNKYLFAQ